MHYATVAYIPALHQGYLDFFKKYPGVLYILDETLVREVPRLDRDIRALAAADAAALLSGAGLFEKIVVLDKGGLPELQKTDLTIVMPDEDVSGRFAETHLKGKEVEFVPVFLRWDKQISTKEFAVPADRTISEDEAHKEIIGRALEEAKKSPDWWRQIGAIIVKDGKSVLIGYNKPLVAPDYTLGAFGDPRSNFDAGVGFEISKVLHAEAGVISEAAKRGIALEGASIYSTTFPCPVCAKSIAAAGVKRVYYARGYSLLDAEDILKAFGVEIVLVQ